MTAPATNGVAVLDRPVALSPDSVRVGQVYKSTQAQHLGWLVSVRKVGGNHIEVEGLNPPNENGRRHNYLAAQFLLNFELVKDVPVIALKSTRVAADPSLNAQVEPSPVVTSKVCTACDAEKPIADFPFVYVTRGESKGQIMGTRAICKMCNYARQQAGLARRRASKHPPMVPHALPEPTQAMEPMADSVVADVVAEVPAVTGTLTNELRALAMRVAEIERFADDRESYQALVQATTDCYLAASLTHGVYIVPQGALDAVHSALERLDRKPDGAS